MKLRRQPRRPHGPYRNRKRYQNGVCIPIIVFLAVVASLLGTHWINQVRAQHLAQRLDIEARQLEHDAIDLRGHIKDLEGRASALLTRDAVNARLQAAGIQMTAIKSSGTLAIHATAPAAQNIAQADTSTAPSNLE